MALPAKKGDMDVFNLSAGLCCQYPPDSLPTPLETATVKVGGQPLVLQTSPLPPVNGTWTGTCGPFGICPPQTRVIISGVNRKVQAEGRLVAVIGDLTNSQGFSDRPIFGPGLVNGRVFIC